MPAPDSVTAKLVQKVRSIAAVGGDQRPHRRGRHDHRRRLVIDEVSCDPALFLLDSVRRECWLASSATASIVARRSTIPCGFGTHRWRCGARARLPPGLELAGEPRPQPAKSAALAAAPPDKAQDRRALDRDFDLFELRMVASVSRCEPAFGPALASPASPRAVASRLDRPCRRTLPASTSAA